jgi:preprotein translocase subunit SecA
MSSKKFGTKDLNTLIEELVVTDPDDKTKLIEEFYMLKKEFEKKPSVYKNNKSFINWKENDIRNWVESFKRETQRKDEKEQQYIRRQVFAMLKLEALVVVIKAMELTFKESHEVQILSVLLLMGKKFNQGRLAQILTGEGKSLIIAMLAALKVLEGKKVDVVTSSEVLAERDAQYSKFLSFYELLDVSVSHNIKNEDPVSGPKSCYLYDVVYGTVHTFQADILRDEYKLEGTLNRRYGDTVGGNENTVVIVDEVDSMLIDAHSASTLLAEETPGHEKLTYLLLMIWIELKKISTKQKKNKGKSKIDVQSYLERFITEIVNERDENRNSYLPEYLKDFALKSIPRWVNSAILALLVFKENHHYIISKGNIEPLDFRNTGIVQKKTHFSNGLHQFLQLQHKLKLTPENLMTNYLSNIGFFKRYRSSENNNIFGLTGTLGTEREQKLLAKIYELDFVFIPSNKPNQLEIRDPRLMKSKNKWIKEIIKSLKPEIDRDRAVLIICETIAMVEVIENELKTGLNNCKFVKYTRNDVVENQEFINEEIEKQTIILSTNLAGRGMDLKMNKEVQRNGGLHVCVAFLPINLRVQKQAFGRTARNGERGTAQLVLNYSVEVEKFGFDHEIANKIAKLQNSYRGNDFSKSKIEEYCKINDIPNTFDDFERYRNDKENKLLESAENEISKIEIKDELFKEFCSLIKSDIKDLKKDLPTLNAIEERWGIWLSDLDLSKSKSEIKTNFNEQFKEIILSQFANDEVILNANYLNQKCLKALTEGMIPTGILKFYNINLCNY